MHFMAYKTQLPSPASSGSCPLTLCQPGGTHTCQTLFCPWALEQALPLQALAPSLAWASSHTFYKSQWRHCTFSARPSQQPLPHPRTVKPPFQKSSWSCVIFSLSTHASGNAIVEYFPLPIDEGKSMKAGAMSHCLFYLTSMEHNANM